GLPSPTTAWNVSVSVWGFQLRLHLTSRIPAAFSAALCQRQGGQCEPEAPLYTVTQPEGSAPGELALLLPVQVLGSCVLVWRSDVHFARKQLLCPDGERGSWRGTQGAVEWEDTPLIAFLPVSRRHFGLLGLLGAAWAASVALSSSSGAGAVLGSFIGGRLGWPTGRPEMPTTFLGQPWPACMGSWGRQAAVVGGY
uniref:Interleukin 17 receptor E n=1 Tax=Catharus ustulatus TaxID=91951 RepID=A0A8C3V9S7_CATUS